MSPSKHSFPFQHIQNGQLILPIPNGNEQNDHNGQNGQLIACFNHHKDVFIC